MTGYNIETLIKLGATDKARRYLKKLGMSARMKLLLECVPNINATTESLNFFRENFSQEIGAIMMAKHDISKAVTLYNNAKLIK